jgi:N-acetylglutamate synthase-like GNAT family acetyltransferase
MSNEEKTSHHHTLRERLDAAEAAADEVVAEESGQLAGEVGALAVPFEEIAAAVRAAIHPDSLAEGEVVTEPAKETAETAEPPAG